MKKKNYYFDYAATTPLDPKVLKAMMPYLTDTFGNPSSPHETGRKAKEAVDAASRKIAAILGCKPAEFIFTGSATESNNMAIIGIARANKIFGNKIITINTEHKSVLAPCEMLAKEGFEIVKLLVDKSGLVNPQDVAKNLDKKTILVSIAYANNEIGTVQPVREIARVIKSFRSKKNSAYPLLHTDATQAVNYLDINVNNLGVDLMTLSAHKIYGPKGVGGLYVRSGIKIEPLISGGGQQFGLRSGTENVAGIVGFAEALELAGKIKKKEFSRVEKLRNELEKGILEAIPDAIINGYPEKRLPNFLNISIPDLDGETALFRLDQKRISVATGSACNSKICEPSHVISALGLPANYLFGSLRFSLGRQTTKKDVDYVLKILPQVVKDLRLIN